MSFRITGLPAETSGSCSRLTTPSWRALGAVRRAASRRPLPRQPDRRDAGRRGDPGQLRAPQGRQPLPHALRHLCAQGRGRPTTRSTRCREQLRKRSLAARAFDQDGMMVGWELVEGESSKTRSSACSPSRVPPICTCISPRPAAMRRAWNSLRVAHRRHILRVMTGTRDQHCRPARRRARPQIAGRRGRPHPRPRDRRGEGWYANDFICTCGRATTTPRSARPPAASHCCSRQLRGTRPARHLAAVGRLAVPGRGRALLRVLASPWRGRSCLSFQFEPEVFERIAHDAARRPRSRATACRRCASSRGSPRAPVSPWRSPTRSRTSRSSSPAPRCGWPAVRPVQGAGTSSRPHDRSAALHGRARQRRKARRACPHGADEPVSFPAQLQGDDRRHAAPVAVARRLHQAAARLATTRAPVTDIALEVGFADLSNFTRTFHAEFGASPRQYRLAA